MWATITNADTTEELAAPWVVNTDDMTDYFCETHAREWAETYRVPMDSSSSYRLEDENGDPISEAYAVWPYAESDSPISCACGQYLDCQLTGDGLEELKASDYPAWLVTALTK
jgi:hypothetical protein